MSELGFKFKCSSLVQIKNERSCVFVATECLRSDVQVIRRCSQCNPKPGPDQKRASRRALSQSEFSRFLLPSRRSNLVVFFTLQKSNSGRRRAFLNLTAREIRSVPPLLLLLEIDTQMQRILLRSALCVVLLLHVGEQVQGMSRYGNPGHTARIDSSRTSDAPVPAVSSKLSQPVTSLRPRWFPVDL